MAATNGELARYLELTPKSKARWQEAAEYLPGGDSRNSIFWEPYPIFVTSASGCHIRHTKWKASTNSPITMTEMGE